MLRYSIIFVACSFILGTHAFTSNSFAGLQAIAASRSSTIASPFSKRTKIFSTPPEGEDFQQQQLDAFDDPLSANKPSTPEEGNTSYPIDLPSPILLASSMVLAIIGVGSGFDIFADEPRFPLAVNAVISAGGLAVCLGLFYASILKAQAETEEDDKKYMSGR
ncbi:unnamed protein product [Pseudo-nitzschia multistriata]|uniref:Uncharacterized protein n=1 Tax=Pseudo-nitzschia multistriata TaxID=183589 RepID=A0A448YVC5_9STRA|nr:unnamed protein product [Pseudo-nitzschia multistriata]